MAKLSEPTLTRARINRLSIIIIPLILVAGLVITFTHPFSHRPQPSTDANERENAQKDSKNVKYTRSPYLFPDLADLPLIKLNPSYLYLTPDYDIQIDKNVAPTPEQEQKLAIKNAVDKYNTMTHSVYDGGPLSKPPRIVIITILDYLRSDEEHLRKILSNRIDFARSHNPTYGIYIKYTQEYASKLAGVDQNNWSKPAAIRDAMDSFPDTKYFWFIDQDVIIMRNDIDIEEYLLKPKALDPLIIRDVPVTYGGVIKTYRKNPASGVQLIISQDDSGDLDTSSIFIVQSGFSRAFMEIWFDPLYRKFAQFVHEDSKALGHILQWHPVLLAKTAIVPPRVINSNLVDGQTNSGLEREKYDYKEGDLVGNLKTCKTQGAQICSLWFKKFYEEMNAKKEEKS